MMRQLLLFIFIHVVYLLPENHYYSYTTINHSTPNAIDKYIFVLKDNAVLNSNMLAYITTFNLTPLTPPAHIINIFYGQLSPDQLTTLQQYKPLMNLVDWFQRDTVATLAAVPPISSNSSMIIQKGSQQRSISWGLDRTDQKSLPLDNQYHYPSSFVAPTNVYIIDSGINTAHEDFGGRARFGINFSDDPSNSDNIGHGTHVAGIIGGKQFGVAKNANLIAIKVVNKDNLIDGIVLAKALEWVIKEHRVGERAVLNLSILVAGNILVKSLLDKAIRKGIVIVGAAGNEASESCNTLLSYIPSCILVGATDQNDHVTSFSNYGKCVDVFAPGQKIHSTGYLSSTAVKSERGTSFAAPFVSGVAALILSTEATILSPLTVKQRIVKSAIPGKAENNNKSKTPSAILFSLGALGIKSAGFTITTFPSQLLSLISLVFYHFNI